MSSISGIKPFQGSSTSPVKMRVPKDSIGNKIKTGVFFAGSVLTEPFCKSHEYYRRISIVDAMHPSAYKCANLGRKFFLILGAFGWGALGLLTTLPGLILRKAGTSCEKNAYIYSKGSAVPKAIPDNREISLLSWNICCISAGYTISDGGVTPSSFRLDEIIKKLDADVNCLYEVFDVITASYLSKELKKKGYSHFYYNIGANALGVSSGLFVASRYAIADPQFTPFSKTTLAGRTKFANKGVFAFSLIEKKGAKRKTLARIHATHLSHSEKPDSPTKKVTIQIPSMHSHA